MKIKTTYIVIFMMVGFVLFQWENRTAVSAGERDLDLLKLVSVFKAEHILLEEWSFYAREHLVNLKSEKEVKAFAHSIERKFPNWKWTESSTSEKWELNAQSPDSNGHQEMIQIMSTRTNQSIEAYTVYRISAPKWDRQSESFFTTRQYQKRLSNIFHNKPIIFSCINGEFSGKMESALPKTVAGLLAILKAKEIESLKEDKFVSVTAHSPLFTESIDNRNLQIGVRSEGLGAKTAVVIGTPIITIEY